MEIILNASGNKLKIEINDELVEAFAQQSFNIEIPTNMMLAYTIITEFNEPHCFFLSARRFVRTRPNVYYATGPVYKDINIEEVFDNINLFIEKQIDIGIERPTPIYDIEDSGCKYLLFPLRCLKNKELKLSMENNEVRLDTKEGYPIDHYDINNAMYQYFN